jgi:hypothetical protein
VTALRAIVRTTRDARVFVIGTQADVVGTPQDRSGSTLSVDQRMEELIGMVQVCMCVLPAGHWGVSVCLPFLICVCVPAFLDLCVCACLS